MELKSIRFVVLEIMQVLWQGVKNLGGHFRILLNRNGVVTWGDAKRVKKKWKGKETERKTGTETQNEEIWNDRGSEQKQGQR